METSSLLTYQVKIYLSGPIEEAKQILRKRMALYPLCVTIDPTNFIYTGGEETGYVVGLLNYPRYPSTPMKICKEALDIAKELLLGTWQRSALVVTPSMTTWIHREDFKPRGDDAR